MIIKKQFFIYVCVGVLCAVIDIASARALVQAGVYYTWAVSGGFFFSLMINYALHAKVTFQAISSHATMLKYGVVVALNYLITMAFSAVSVHLAGDFIFGKLLSLPVIAVNGFFLSRYWVFR